MADFAYLLREGAELRAVHDRHLCGLFPRETWRRLLAECGFEERVAPRADPRTVGEVFLVVRPSLGR